MATGFCDDLSAIFSEQRFSLLHRASTGTPVLHCSEFNDFHKTFSQLNLKFSRITLSPGDTGGLIRNFLFLCKCVHLTNLRFRANFRANFRSALVDKVRLKVGLIEAFCTTFWLPVQVCCAVLMCSVGKPFLSKLVIGRGAARQNFVNWREAFLPPRS